MCPELRRYCGADREDQALIGPELDGAQHGIAANVVPPLLPSCRL